MLSTFVLYYTLFGRKLDIGAAALTLPNNAFGAFSTIRRSRKLNKYPTDIHGCIGYWDPMFAAIPTTLLLERLLQVSHDSLWNDDRKKYFAPIETDAGAYQELDFLMRPIYKIDKTTGNILGENKLFTNKHYGIIVQSATSRATYLPDVFPNISWNEMVKSIKSKAGITDAAAPFDLYAYKIVQIKMQFISLLTDETFRYICIHNYVRLLIDNAKFNLPFPYIYGRSAAGKYEWNRTDEVRNIATIGEIARHPKIASNAAMKSVANIMQNLASYSSQALSFITPNATRNAEYCRKLLADLPTADDEFAKPEIYIGLGRAGCARPKQSFTYDSSDSIFKMNWTIQAIVSANKKPAARLIAILMNAVDTLLLNKTGVETNYLAVAFEALCFATMPGNKLFELFIELERRRGNDGLYEFLNKTARVDITGHVMNGLKNLSHSIIHDHNS